MMEIRLTDNVVEKLQSLADEKGASVEDYCAELLIDHAMLQWYEDINSKYQEAKRESKIEKTNEYGNEGDKPKGEVEEIPQETHHIDVVQRREESTVQEKPIVQRSKRILK